MSKALYNKYRPKIFAEVVNQNHIKITLQNQIESGKIAQAYLFAGPRGIGKTTIARIFAKAINCLQLKNSEPCGDCQNCRTIQAGQSFDLIEIDAASNRGINEIRELREHVKYPPTVLTHKVFIIDEAHMLSIEAFNALLKTLEEPPAHTIFILATTELHKLPETIISRCQRFDFKKIKVDDIVKHLQMIVTSEQVKVAPGVLENIARHSEGYARDAVSILGQILALNDKEISSEEAALVLPHSDFNLIIELVDYLFKKDLKSAIDLINRLINEGIDLENFTDDLLEYLRKLLLVKVLGSTESLAWELDKNFVQQITLQTELVDLSQLIKILDLLLNRIPNYKYSKIIQLPLEIFAAETVALMAEKINPQNFTEQKQKENSAPQALDETPPPPLKKKTATANLTLEKIGEACPRIFSELKDQNHSLAAFFKSSKPIDFSGNVLKVGFEYQFQLERIIDLKNKRLIEDVMEKICLCPIKIEAVLDPDFHSHQSWNQFAGNTKNPTVNQLAEEFGGEIVN